MLFEPDAMSRKRLYDLLTRIVSPRPIAFVSSISSEGQPNLAPFSYFALGGLQPPSAVFCPVNDRQGRQKDTLNNVTATGEYVIHAVNRAMAASMNETSRAVAPEVNEFDLGGFTAVPSDLVRPPRVLEAPIAMEMRLFRIVSHGTGGLASNYVIGEVLRVHVREEVLGEDGLPDATKVDFIGRMGGDTYVDARPEALFEMPRPKE